MKRLRRWLRRQLPAIVLCTALGLAVAVTRPAAPPATATVLPHARVPQVFDDQVIDTVIPFSIFQAAAAAWGSTAVYGGPASCEIAPNTICMTWVFEPGWAGYTVRSLSGIFLSPALAGRSRADQQEVIEHEMGNALGVPEEACGAANVMSQCVDGYLNVP